MSNRKTPCEKAVQAAKMFGEGKSYTFIMNALGLRDRTEAKNKVSEGQKHERR